MKKHLLLRALDGIIANLREATAAIQRDDFEAAVENLRDADAAIRETAEELAA